MADKLQKLIIEGNCVTGGASSRRSDRYDMVGARLNRCQRLHQQIVKI